MKNLFVFLAIVLAWCCKQRKTDIKPVFNDALAFNVKGDPEIMTDSLFIIDSLGNLQPDSVYLEQGYWKAGGIIRYLTFDSTGINAVAYYLHDSAGRFVGQYTIGAGKLMDSFYIQKDSNGKESLLQYDSSRKLVQTIKDITRAKYGLLATGKYYNEHGQLTGSFVNKFENDIFRGYTIYDSTNKIDSEMNTKANEHDDVTEEKRFKSKDSFITVTTYRYEGYDSIGNYTRRIEINTQGKPVKLLKRTFTYATVKK